MASRDDGAMFCIVEEERRSHRRSRPARVPRYFQITALRICQKNLLAIRETVSVQWLSKIGGRPSLACLGASPTSRAARYARAQLVKRLRTRFRRVAATRARMPRLRFIVPNWILVDPLNAYKRISIRQITYLSEQRI